jgi:hypothetical protein
MFLANHFHNSAEQEAGLIYARGREKKGIGKGKERCRNREGGKAFNKFVL